MEKPARTWGEFELIDRIFAPLSKGYPLAFNLMDDAAVVRTTAGHELVVTKDALIAGVHFLPDDPADLVARKALRVNLSDLAAKAARPVGYLLGAILPHDVEWAWLEAFASGLRADNEAYRIALVGGDTTATDGPLTLCITAFGEVPKGAMVLRSTSKVGDDIYVTGTIGDATLGLAILKGEAVCEDEQDRNFLIERYRLPRPRLQIGTGLRGIASASIDISDGLAGDLCHVTDASLIGALIEEVLVPLSDPARRLVQRMPELITRILSGGDDYELLFTAPRSHASAIERLAAAAKTPITRIGKMTHGQQAKILGRDGKMVTLEKPGYTHF